jgi:hypothetical protein
MSELNEEDIESVQKTVEKLLSEQDYYAILNVEPTVSFFSLVHRPQMMRSVKHTRNGV